LRAAGSPLLDNVGKLVGHKSPIGRGDAEDNLLPGGCGVCVEAIHRFASSKIGFDPREILPKGEFHRLAIGEA
jgi:hypothetical protein